MTLTQFEEEAGTRERLLIEWQEARPSRGVWPVSCPAFDSASYQPTAACRQRRRQWATDKRTRSMGQALANFQSYPLTFLGVAWMANLSYRAAQNEEINQHKRWQANVLFSEQIKKKLISVQEVYAPARDICVLHK